MVHRMYRKQMRRLKRVESELQYWQACSVIGQYPSSGSNIVASTENHRDSQLAFEKMYRLPNKP
jgi:hypothetical protein